MSGVSQAEYWNADAAVRWVRTQPVMDALLAAHGEAALGAARLAPGDWVLDVGCGCGATTLSTAEKVGPRGLAVGVDISAPMLAHARSRAASARLVNARFDVGDAQRDPLGAERYDAVISRFGIMFFEDPERAFTQIKKALRRGGRFAAVCWRGVEDNPWIGLPVAAVSAFVETEPVDPSVPGPHSLQSRERIGSLLDAAGFSVVRVQPLDLPLTFAKSAEEAARLLVLLGPTGRALSRATEEVRMRAHAVVTRALAPFCTPGAVRMPSGAWLVTARSAG